MSDEPNLFDSPNGTWKFGHAQDSFKFTESPRDFVPKRTGQWHDIEAVSQLNSCTAVLQEVVTKHNVILADFLKSPDGALASELKTSMQKLLNQCERLTQVTSAAVNEIDMLRNDNVLRTREFVSLQATLLEAEHQLEQASERDRQLTSLRQAYLKLEKRLEHTVRTVSSENRPYWDCNGFSSVDCTEFPGSPVHSAETMYAGQRNRSTVLQGDSPKQVIDDVAAVKHLLVQLEATQQKLDAQIEQSNELEALLADRESRVVTQGHELNEAESQLIESAHLINQLHERLSANHHYLNQLLQQFNSTSLPNNVEQLPAVPAVLELARNLDAVYAELQDSERLRLIAERRASSATTTARQLRTRLRHIVSELEGDSLDSVHTAVSPSVCVASTQTLPHLGIARAVQTVPSNVPDFSESKAETDSNTNASQERIITYAFSRPSEVMATLATKEQATPEQVIQLKEALRNAIIQVERLNKYRLTQKSKIEQMQQRFIQLNSELDATVDALRYHQTSSEDERRRTASELSGLRMQLAKANALLNHQRARNTKMNSSPFNVADRASSMSPVTNRAFVPGKEVISSSEDIELQLTMAQSELSQLRADMTRQKTDSDRETTKLRGQLAEATADIRTLRLQLTRIQTAASVAQRNAGNDQAAIVDIACSNCQRLQRLLDIIQRKTNDNSAISSSVEQSPRNASAELTGKSSESNALIPIGSLDFEQHPKEGQEQRDVLVTQEEIVQSNFESISFELHNKRHQLIQTEKEIDEIRARHHEEVIHLQEEKLRIVQEREFLQEERRRLLEHEEDVFRKEKEMEALILIASRNKHMFKDSLQAQIIEAGTHTHSASQHFPDSSEPENTNNSLVGDPCNSCSIVTHSKAVQTDVYEQLSGFPDSNNITESRSFQLIGESFGELEFNGTSNTQDFISDQLRSRYNCLQDMAEELLVLRSRLYDEQQALEKAKLEFRKMREVQSTMLERTANSTTSAPEICTHTDKSAPAQSDTPEIPYDVLMHRLQAAEREAEDAVAQLRASNSEFLTLRERVSYASVERAHLKSTIEGLDEQVSRLESCLYERTQQLNQCRDELIKATGRYVIPLDTALGGVHVSKTLKYTTFSRVTTRLKCPRHISELFRSILSLPELVRNSDNVTLPILDPSRGICASRWSYQTMAQQRLDRIKSSLCAVLPSMTNCRLLCSRLVKIRTRFILHSPPRPSILICTFVYLVVVHLLLFYWIL